MANANNPFGLRPVGTLNGASYSGQIRQYFVPATDGTAIYVGSPVKLGGTEGSLNADDLPMPTATAAASTNTIIGVCVGVQPLPTALQTLYRPAATAMYIYVDVDPNTIYEIQGDSDTYDAADIGMNMNYTVVAGSTVTGLSKTVADQSSAAVTATLDMQVLASKPSINNELTGGYPLLLVRLNLNQFANSATGIS
jgi:hypothetical protein